MNISKTTKRSCRITILEELKVELNKPSLRNVLAILIIAIFFSLIISSVYSDLPENYVRISCFTQNNLELDYLSLNFIALENNTMILGGFNNF